MTMWNNQKNVLNRLLKFYNFLSVNKRTTYILRRTREIPVQELDCAIPLRFKRASYYYELVEDTNCKAKPLLELVLVKDVPGVGMVGEKIKVNCYIGYRDLLLPKLAIYADSPEAEKIMRPQDLTVLSSKYSKVVGNYILQQPLQIFLNGVTNWTLKSWHINLALRRSGIIANESCIIMPKYEIAGPNQNVENKDFIVRIKMNNSEIFPIRCRIYHWKGSEMLPSVMDKSILHTESTALFTEEQEEINFLIKQEQELKESKKIFKSINIK